MQQSNDARIIEIDDDGTARFNASFINVNYLIINISYLIAPLDQLTSEYDSLKNTSSEDMKALYEKVFRQEEFTGRSGSMFGFEGLGCIWWHMVAYGGIWWHMVAKLLLAVQENYFNALDQQAEDVTCNSLANYYYLVRQGLGFNKTPAQYGAFLTDPYSHTPSHSGAQQPGMTGQVKEEIISRFGELGIRVSEGRIKFDPILLRAQEFVRNPQPFRYLDLFDGWQEIQLSGNSLAFTWCQVPIVYQLADKASVNISIHWRDGHSEQLERPALSRETSALIFSRSGEIKKISVLLAPVHLTANPGARC